MAIKITPQQLIQQWATLPNKFDVNVLNFEVAMGMDAVEIFRKSFYLKRFNSPGSTAWVPRKDHKSHPLLEETGTMKRSISYKRFTYGKAQGVIVHTDPRGYFRSKRQNGRNFCYAAIHNMGGANLPSVGGRASYTPQRQFMGKSIYITERARANSYIIFNGFPT